MITIKQYVSSDKRIWNDFVARSVNGTFLFNRDFMEYHKERFTDHSLLIYNKKRLIALLPANEKRNNIYSHEGLTYGGLIVLPNTPFITTLSCFYALTKYYYQHGYKTMYYKPVPTFFHSQSYLEDQYALFRLNAKLSAMNTGFVASLPTQLAKRRTRMVRKAKRYGIIVRRAKDCRLFWREILIPHLKTKFRTKPVHTVEEIELLRKHFSTSIVQYNAYVEKNIIAGVTVFLNRSVAHSQYIANNEQGRKLGALDYLFWHLLTKVYKNQQYFSFGTANMGSPEGRLLSRGLVEWKEGFGASMVPYPCYIIEMKNYTKLKEYS